jgi:hypothetical protein
MSMDTYTDIDTDKDVDRDIDMGIDMAVDMATDMDIVDMSKVIAMDMGTWICT